MKYIRKEKGITLVALVVTIIVLLILAGITISMALSNNGLINRTESAVEKNDLSIFLEDARLAYADIYIEKTKNGESNNSITLEEVIARLVDNNEKYKETIQAVNSGELQDFTLSEDNIEIVERVKDKKSKTISIIPKGSEMKYYIRIRNNYYQIFIEESEIKVGDTLSEIPKLDQEYTLTATSNNSFYCTAEANTNNLTITVTAQRSYYLPINITVNYGTYTANITAKVNGAYDAEAIANDGGTVSISDDGPFEDYTPVTMTATPNPGYKFDYWYWDYSGNKFRKEETYGSDLVIDEDAKLTYKGERGGKFTAFFSKIGLPFRDYGIPVNKDFYGSTVELNSGNEIQVGNSKISDNWKVFFEDEYYKYLVYGDYYPAAAQTKVENDGTKILMPAQEDNGTSSSYLFSVNCRQGGREQFLKYLRNSSGYKWDQSYWWGADNYFGDGETYKSWDDLKEGLEKLNSLKEKTITIQATPDIELWKSSWNAIYPNNQIKYTKIREGYKVGIGDNDNSNDIRLNQTNDGYNNTLFFPHKEKNDQAIGIWLASPASVNTSFCLVATYSGSITGNASLTLDYLSLRPVIAIKK